MNRSYYNRSRGVRQQRYSTAMPYTSCPCEEAARVTEAVDCDDMVVAMAYIPAQTCASVYEPDTAFMQGTLFPELDKPWMAGGSCNG